MIFTGNIEPKTLCRGYRDVNVMKTKNLFLFAGIAVTAIVVFQIVKQKKTRKRMAVVADEGYETAEDILFPKGRSLRLG